MKTVLQKVGFFTAFIIPALVCAGVYAGGWANFSTIAFAFVILPAIDQYLGLNKQNYSADEARVVGEEYFYRFITYIWTWFQVAFVLWGIYVVSTGMLATWYEWTGFILSFSLMTGGIGITVAHELGHKKSSVERFYSKLLLMTVCYMHFYIEHNRGHHVTVATPEDPATARKNESFYHFWVRSVFGGYTHAWKLERERLKNKGLPLFSVQNEMIWYGILPVFFAASATVVASLLLDRFVWEVPLFFFAQSIIAFSLLELVNYVEHYGIRRKEVSPGRYERVNPLHSWNASHLVSNFFLFQLQRHSDHHAFAYKRYQVLNHYEESPQLPFGYPTMIILAMFPPLWFRMMNTRLENWSRITYREAHS